ncbi:hypothetical protein HMPREF1233_0226 [Streptococcus pyogenes GA19700]|nr:hypothetical protein HMPREF1233_0226 [Streptococcus pyogenes GA19700]
MRAIRTVQRHDPMRFQPREEQARHPTVMPHRRRSQSRTGEIRLPTLHDHGQTRNHRLRKPAPAPLAQVHRTGPQIRVAQTRQPAVIEPPLPAETARPLTEGRRGEPRAQPTRVHRIRASGVPFQRPDGLAVLAYGGFHITGPVKRADHLARDMANRRLTHGKLLRSNQMGQDEHNPER